jgi:hypothetical protein
MLLHRGPAAKCRPVELAIIRAAKKQILRTGVLRERGLGRKRRGAAWASDSHCEPSHRGRELRRYPVRRHDRMLHGERLTLASNVDDKRKKQQRQCAYLLKSCSRDGALVSMWCS